MGIEEICVPDLVVTGKAKGITSSCLPPFGAAKQWDAASSTPMIRSYQRRYGDHAVLAYLESSLRECHTVEVCC
jgi:hypothetical protein